jgi:hypothetical protein
MTPRALPRVLLSDLDITTLADNAIEDLARRMAQRISGDPETPGPAQTLHVLAYLRRAMDRCELRATRAAFDL